MITLEQTVKHAANFDDFLSRTLGRILKSHQKYKQAPENDYGRDTAIYVGEMEANIVTLRIALECHQVELKALEDDKLAYLPLQKAASKGLKNAPKFGEPHAPRSA